MQSSDDSKKLFLLPSAELENFYKFIDILALTSQQTSMT